MPRAGKGGSTGDSSGANADSDSERASSRRAALDELRQRQRNPDSVIGGLLPPGKARTHLHGIEHRPTLTGRQRRRGPATTAGLASDTVPRCETTPGRPAGQAQSMACRRTRGGWNRTARSIARHQQCNALVLRKMSGVRRSASDGAVRQSPRRGSGARMARIPPTRAPHRRCPRRSPSDPAGGVAAAEEAARHQASMASQTPNDGG